MKHTQLFLLFLTLFISIKANAVENVNTKPLSELTLNQSYKFTAQAIALKSVTLSSEITGVIQSKQHLIGTQINILSIS